MCGWCCGGVPVERRGKGHQGCSAECHNAPTPKRVAIALARAEQAEAEVQRLRAAIASVADLCETWDVYSKRPTGTTTAIRERLGITPPASTRGRR